MESLGDSGAPSQQQPHREGQKVGSYRLLTFLGHGGMGAVYSAINEETQGLCAVKVLGTRFAQDEEAHRRFRDEAKAAAAVNDPGLVKVFDFGKLPDGTPCIMMQLLEGQLLRHRLKKFLKNQSPVDWAVRVTMLVAKALAAAHRNAIVHLDVKPENVMLVADAAVEGGERPILLDFGIAKLLQAPTPQNAMLNRPFGTPTYMSPEQCRRSDRLDARSDVYSLGCMLYEMLCGVPPYQPIAGDLSYVTNQHLYGTPNPARIYRQGIPSSVQRLLDSMLRRDANMRPGSEKVAEICQEVLNQYQVGTQHAVRSSMPLVIFAVLGIMLAFLLKPWSGRNGSSWRADNMVLHPAGTSTMGSNPQEVAEALRLAQGPLACPLCKPEQFARELPARRVTMDAFYLDRFEVTNEQFASWLNKQGPVIEQTTIPVEEKLSDDVIPKPKAQRHRSITAIRNGNVRVALIDTENRILQGIRGLWVDGNRVQVIPGMDKKPVIHVTWDGANLFCQSQGKRLPTEAEWERAARGLNGRMFPWGAVLPLREELVLGWPGALARPRDVGSSPRDRTPEGVYDLAGNVSEWTTDFFVAPYPTCSHCRNPVQGRSPGGDDPRRVVRGGSWSKEPDSARGASRSRWPSKQTTGDIGFRCARNAASS